MTTSIEKQLHWGLTKMFYRSNCKSSRRLRIKEQAIGIKQRINQYSFLAQKIYQEGKKAFTTTLILPSAKYSNNAGTQKLFFDDLRSTSILDNFFSMLREKSGIHYQIISEISKLATVCSKNC